MIVQCECGRKLKPKAGFAGKPGQTVVLTCPATTCGTRLRFTVPERPVGSTFADLSALGAMFGEWDFGATRG